MIEKMSHPIADISHRPSLRKDQCHYIVDLVLDDANILYLQYVFICYSKSLIQSYFAEQYNLHFRLHKSSTKNVTEVIKNIIV